jgi:hypothetical protein
MGRLKNRHHTHCFYTVTSGIGLGALHISDRSGRKKRDEPFNPFAPNASAQRNKRQTERKNVERRAAPARPSPNQPQPNAGMTELAKKQKEAMERMKKQGGPVGKSATAPAAAQPKQTQLRRQRPPSPKSLMKIGWPNSGGNLRFHGKMQNPKQSKLSKPSQNLLPLKQQSLRHR